MLNYGVRQKIGRKLVAFRWILFNWTEQDIKWYKAAADQGNSDAQFFLGAMYLLPQRDIPEGLKWLKLSADQGMQDAQFLLGMAYLKGQNFTHDPVQAYMWLE